MKTYQAITADRNFHIHVFPKSHIVLDTFEEGRLVERKRLDVGDTAVFSAFGKTYTGQIGSIGEFWIYMTQEERGLPDSQFRIGASEFAWRNGGAV